MRVDAEPSVGSTVGTSVKHVDVMIVGAGLSGIGAAVHLQTKCPDKTYAVIEARDRMGGTWDLFRYPGIRSDSDMFTLGYAFKPWEDGKAIADGPSILSYIEETAREHEIDKKIQYGLRLERADWSSKDALWTVSLRESQTGELRKMSCRVLMACTGYYRYDEGYTPDFAGRDNYQGEIVHPQFWPEDLDYKNKKIVVIGSGATAVTLVPSLAEQAEHVTMLQRSPTYIVSMPDEDRIANLLRRMLPAKAAYAVTRWKNVAMAMAMYKASRRFPDAVKRLIMSGAKKALGEDYDVNTHFNPRYKPWDQRICLVPNGDLFKAIKNKKASVVTDEITAFTQNGIQLRSGKELDADVIVTATGLNLQLFGGADLFVDDQHVKPSDSMAYRAMMVGDVPNLVFAVGYTNASWTLKVDLVCDYLCRLLNYMDEHDYKACLPRRDPDIEEMPLLDFSAGYVKRALDELPRGGKKHPWRIFENYALDRVSLKHSKFDDGVLEFS